MTTLNDIDLKTREFSKQRNRLVEQVTDLNEQIEKLKRKHLPEIKFLVNATAQAQAELQALLEASPGLFTKPRTMIFHGVKVGFAKQKGKIEIADEEKTIALIRKQLPDVADVLLSTEIHVSKTALANVAVSDLKKIGCNVVADTDAVVIKPTDSEVDKLVTALLKDATEEVGA